MTADEFVEQVKNWVQENDPDRQVTLFLEIKHLVPEVVPARSPIYDAERQMVELVQRHGLPIPIHSSARR